MIENITAKKQKLSEIEAEIQSKLSLKTTLEKEIKEFEDNIRFIPKINELYFFIDTSNNISTSKNNEFAWDNARFSALNCFKTKEEAQLEADRILLLRELRQFAKECNADWIPDWEDRGVKFGIQFRVKLEVTFYVSLNAFIGGIAFRNKESAINALEKFRNRLHILVNN